MEFHPFLGFFGSYEYEISAQVMYEIYKKTGRREFSDEDFQHDDMAEYGILEWSHPKYMIKEDNLYCPTDFFFAEVERKIKELNPEYAKQFRVAR